MVAEPVSFLNFTCVKQLITRASDHPGQWPSCPLRAGSVFRLQMKLYQPARHELTRDLRTSKCKTESGKNSRGRRIPQLRGGVVSFCLFVVVFVRSSPLYPEVMKCFYSSSVIA